VKIMLVLTRRIGEKVVIDGSIYVTVLEVQGNKVRIGVAAPPDMVVDRLEVSQRRQEWSARPWQQRSNVKDCRSTSDGDSLLAEVTP
jgi:carbon storage regulator